MAKNKPLSQVALENSSYSLMLTIILKFGGLVFTILIARLLLPELFGIYSLALSIATIILSFTDLGVDNTFLRYFSGSLGEKNKLKSRAYFKYLIKIKSILLFSFVFLILLFARFISYNIYNKPLLFLSIIFVCLFVIMESLTSFLGNILIASKDLKSLPLLTTLNQALKIGLSVLAISLVNYEFKVPGLFIAFAISGGIYLILMFSIAYKKNKDFLIGKTGDIDKKTVNTYLRYMAVSSLSLAFFASLDILMLGKFVPVEYLGYYRVSSSLILTIASLFSLSTIFIPIFTQINDERFVRGFKKTLRYILLLSIPATAGVIFISKYLIKAIYGNEYLLGTIPLCFLSILILTTPLIGLYSMIFQSKEKPRLVSNAILISLLTNILLNLLAIYVFDNPLYKIAGVALATSLSRILLLVFLMISSKREFNFSIRGVGLKAPIFGTVIMSLFLIIFNELVNMNILFGIMEIFLGVAVYFLILILMKALNKEDILLLKNILRK